MTPFNHRNNKKRAMAGTITIKKLVKKNFDLSAYPSHMPDSMPESLLPILTETLMNKIFAVVMLIYAGLTISAQAASGDLDTTFGI